MHPEGSLPDHLTRTALPRAFAVVELGSIARGLSVVDALVKRAPVRLVLADPVTPGKYLIAFAGGEEECLEALDAAEEAAMGPLLDRLLLPGIHSSLAAVLEGQIPRVELEEHESVGILEMGTVAATVLSADAALKATAVRLVALHLARGVGGKGYHAFAGRQDEVEAALEAGDEIVEPRLREGRELIARPHPELAFALGRLNRGSGA